jgi:hypothetical protein
MIIVTLTAALAAESGAQVTPGRTLGKRTALAVGQPGLHRIEPFRPVQTQPFYRHRTRSSFSGGCGRYAVPLPALQNTAGFYNVELDDSFGNACGGGHVEVALLFDLAPIKNYGGIVRSASLEVTQSAYPDCDWLVSVTSVDRHCYSDGAGRPEAKPRGCFAVEVLSHWPQTPAGGAPGFATIPNMRFELAGDRFNVTDAIHRQVSGVLGGPPGAGLLLKPYLTTDRLDGQDNTKCLSAISNVLLRVTYEIPPSGPPAVIR